MPSRSFAATTLVSSPVGAIAAPAAEQARDNVVFETDVAAQFRPCPSCGRYMQAIYGLNIYECKECRLLVTVQDERHGSRSLIETAAQSPVGNG